MTIRTQKSYKSDWLLENLQIVCLFESGAQPLLIRSKERRKETRNERRKEKNDKYIILSTSIKYTYRYQVKNDANTTVTKLLMVFSQLCLDQFWRLSLRNSLIPAHIFFIPWKNGSSKCPTFDTGRALCRDAVLKYLSRRDLVAWRPFVASQVNM